jgi:diaminopimelate epimerase
MTGSTSFRKMNGLGNDFVVLDARVHPLALKAAQIAAIADRSRGIGCDQVIALEPSDFADVFMRIWNADGGEVGAAAMPRAARGAPCRRARVASRLHRDPESAAADRRQDGSVTIDTGPAFRLERSRSAEVRFRAAIELPQCGEFPLGAASMVNVATPLHLFVQNIEAQPARFGLERGPSLFRARQDLARAGHRISLAAPHPGARRRAHTAWAPGGPAAQRGCRPRGAAACVAVRRGIAGRSRHRLAPRRGFDPILTDSGPSSPGPIVHHPARSLLRK